jgi:hypothetical protein
MALDKKKFDKYLKIENGIVYTKVPAKINLNLSEYKDIDEELNMEDDEEIAEVSNNIYEVPGFFTLEFPDNMDSIQFYFPYNVYLFIPDESSQTSKEINLVYGEEEAVFYAKYKKEETNIKILDRLFENGVKYLSNRMDLLIYNIWKQINSTLNVPWHQIESMITQLYAVKENGKWIPSRLSKNQEYCKECALNTKQSAHKLNDLLGFFYGYSNDALMAAVTKPESNKETNSVIENIIKGNFN